MILRSASDTVVTMKKSIKFVQFIVIGIIFSSALFSCICKENEGVKDERELIQLTPQERSYILKEMREFLFSLNAVTNGISSEDRILAGEAAYKSGANFEAHIGAAPSTLNDKLPEAFKTIRNRIHTNFDELGETIKNGSSDRDIIARSGNIMGKCVACHTRYRVN